MYGSLVEDIPMSLRGKDIVKCCCGQHAKLNHICVYDTKLFLHSVILIAAARTSVKKFQKKEDAMTPKRKPTKPTKGMELDIDLEQEFTSTPPHQWILTQVICILTCFVAGDGKCTIY